jgi:DNA segregation ATPase FtsK/SpoIIIE, S-DNA-T family
VSANRFRRLAEEASADEAEKPSPRSRRKVGAKPLLPQLNPETAKRLRLVGGVFLMLFSIYLMVSLVSHLFTGAADQSLLLLEPELAANTGGKLGALLAEWVLTNGFGIAGLLVPVYLLLVGFVVVEQRMRRHLSRFFVPLFVALYWVSAFMGLVTLLFGLSNLTLAGGIGMYLAEWIAYFIGKPGLVIVLGFSLYIFVSAYLPNKPSWWRWISAKVAIWLGENEQPTQPESKPLVAEAPVVSQVEATPVEDDLFAVPNLSFADTEVEPKVVKEKETAFAASDEVPVLAEGSFHVVARRISEVSPAEQEVLLARTQTPEPAIAVGAENPVLEAIRAYTANRAGSGVGFAPIPVLPNANQDLLTTEDTHIPLSFDPADFPLAGTPTNRLVAPGKTHATEVAFTVETAPEEPRHVVEFSMENLPATNVYEVATDQFAKITPDADQESLEDEEEVGDWEAYDPTRDLPDYRFPPIELLKGHDNMAGVTVSREELEYSKNLIIETLLNFKIEIESIRATIGPTVTLYEIVPKPHIRISKIKGLEDDIAMRLEALSSRIIAPMPGKGTIGIEVPNSRPELVSFRSLIATEKFRDFQGELPVAFGKTVTNEVLITDLTKMPHLLVAGATGQGKSVGLNCILASLLYKKHPSQVKFVLIDPKKVEMNLFEALNKHYLASLPDMDEAIITDTKQVLRVLNSLCVEMDSRYELLKMARCRNLLEYNGKFKERRLNPNKGHRFLPYIVLVIDELADLMMTAGKEVEPPICRLAQLARAIGIHLVVATQRPSVDIITGKIKANFPARVSYRVMSKVDSRTVLDANGAEQLIGRGDMLLKAGSDQVRLQNGFIDTEECERIVEFIAAQPGYTETYQLPEVADPDNDDSDHDGYEEGERDALFADAARLVVMHQQGSTSIIQRRLKLGYNRAGRIMDQLEHAGIVGGNKGSKARDVLVSDLTELELYL